MEEVPIYERGSFWGLASLALAAVLGAVSLILPPTTLAKWLLIIAWALAIIPLWMLCNVLANKAVTYFLVICCSVGLAFGLEALWNMRVVSQPSEAATVKIVEIPPSSSKNENPSSPNGVLPPNVILVPSSTSKPKPKEQAPLAEHPKQSEPENSSSQTAASLQQQEIVKLAADGTSFVYSLKSALDHYQSQVQWWKSVAANNGGSEAGLQTMLKSEMTDLSDNYKQNFRNRALEVRSSLLGHVRQRPSETPYLRGDELEEAYGLRFGPNGLVPPYDIEAQIYDLKSLVNELERENNLTITCTDVVTTYDKL